MTNPFSVMYESGCNYQSNSVKIAEGVVVFDACGECASCHAVSITSPVVATDVRGLPRRPATASEVALYRDGQVDPPAEQARREFVIPRAQAEADHVAAVQAGNTYEIGRTEKRCDDLYRAERKLTAELTEAQAMTRHVAEVIPPAPCTTRWTIVFDLGPESCGVYADGSEPTWAPGQDARDPGHGTIRPWMLDLVRRAEIPEPARSALLAAAERLVVKS